MIKPHIKGRNFERETAKDLSKKFDTDVKRTPNSGALHHFMSCDIITIDQGSILYDLHIECKKQQSLNAHKIYWRTRDIAPVGKTPIVIWKKNNDPEPIVIVGYEDFCNYLKIIEEQRG